MVMTARANGVIDTLAIKAPVKVRSVSAITAVGEQTHNGVALVEGDRVLRMDETDQTLNGIWDVRQTAWVRSPDCDGVYDLVKGTVVKVTDGTLHAGEWYEVTSANPITIGTSSIAFQVTSIPNVGASIHVSSAKTTPVDADETVLSDSEDGFSTKKLTFANLWAWTLAKIQSVALAIKDANFTLQDYADATKQAKFQVSGVTAGQTRTITVPDVDITLVGLAATQTLQNKTLDNTNAVTVKDTNFTLQDDGDATKQVKFQLSGQTTGTTRTLTPPNADAALAGTNVAQVFTAQQTPMNGALTDGATIDWNGNTNGQVVSVTLGGNRTMNAPTNIQQYALYILRVSQDATGSRTLAWNAAYKFGTAGAPTLTTTASKVDILSFLGGAGNTLEFIGSRLDAV